MKKLTLLSVTHFCVDMACAALFFGRLRLDAGWWLWMILYNACAFALQLPHRVFWLRTEMRPMDTSILAL